ncbi:hypothetical protein GCM10009801_81860 [Streptomyces albiaxialis]|uniref:DUF8175 domain-containing protein n=1 Tax=Streptomyces albiaxialis TaxID=329523 RepID=A0ABN2X6G6_9ACTN
MSLDLKERSQRRMRLLIAVLVCVVVLLVALVVAVATAGDDGDDKAKGGRDGGTSAQPEPSASASTLPEDDGYTDPDTWIKLPKGDGKENGLPVEFPHTVRGAAAMAVAANRNAWTFDKDAVKRGAETYTVAQYRAPMAKQAAASAAAVAQFAGVPSGQTPPKDATINGAPIGVQWKQISKDRVQVFTLTRITSSAGDGAESKTRLQAVPAEVVWEGGDWKTTPTPKGGTPEAPEPADLGSSKFSELGWKAIQEGDR